MNVAGSEKDSVNEQTNMKYNIYKSFVEIKEVMQLSFGCNSISG